jgi:hypothetical protein
LLYYLNVLIVTVYIYIQVNYVNPHKTKGVGYNLLASFSTQTQDPYVWFVIFPVNFNIPPSTVLSLLCNEINHKTPRVVFPNLNKSNTSYWSHMHTCWSNKNNYINYGISIPKNKINAYRNKYNTSGPKLSFIVSMVQNKPRKPTNTSIAFIDLDLHNYD